MTALPAEVQKVLDEANSGTTTEVPDPEIIPPPDTVVELSGGCLDPSGSWVREAEVRELTGRDEEALARVKDVGRWMTLLLERGTVRIGSEPSSPDVLDGLLAGDWELLLLHIRAVTFGKEYETETVCRSCGSEYSVQIDVTKDIPVRAANPDEFTFSVRGKRQTYEVSLRSGATQRKVLEKLSDLSVAEMNTLVLYECVSVIDGLPVMGMDAIRDMPMQDRQTLLTEIRNRQPGPDLQGVTTKCPDCGAEQTLALSVAALFQR
jgi:hypothetical protein